MKAGTGGREEPLSLSAETPEALLVAWLEELIFRLSARGEVFVSAAFEVLGPTRLEGTARWRGLWDEEAPKLEVKAATYHGLKVVRGPSSWTATVILDV